MKERIGEVVVGGSVIRWTGIVLLGREWIPESWWVVLVGGSSLLEEECE